MNKIIRFYNQNRKVIWISILIIIGIFALVRTLNSRYKELSTNDISSSANSTTTYNKEHYAIISKTKISNDLKEKIIKIIDDFIKYCNDGEIEKAYNLLSEDCKANIFPSIENFENNYYNKIFNQDRKYDIQAWINTDKLYTYKIVITGDMLASGGNSSDFQIEDYYTILKENESYRLNINNYIGKETLNIQKQTEEVSISIKEKNMYVDYEIYTIKVKNNTLKNILLDSKEETRNVYLEDQNEVRYIAFLNELTLDELLVKGGATKNLEIKFNKSYNPRYEIKTMKFKDLIFNYNKDLTKEKITRSEIDIEI